MFYLKYQFNEEPPVYIADVELKGFLEDHLVANEFGLETWVSSDKNYDPILSYMVSELEFDKNGDLIFLTLSEEGPRSLREQ